MAWALMSGDAGVAPISSGGAPIIACCICAFSSSLFRTRLILMRSMISCQRRRWLISGFCTRLGSSSVMFLSRTMRLSSSPLYARAWKR